MLNPEKIWHQYLVHLPISTVSLYRSHSTLEIQKKLFFNSIIHTCLRFFSRFLTSSQEKTNCYPLTHHTWKMSLVVPCKMHNFFIWLKLCCIPPNVGGSKKSRFWVGIGSSEKNRQMVCQARNVTANVQSDHLLHGYMLPAFFRHWSTASSITLRSAEIQSMSQQDACATRPYRGLILDTPEKNEKDEKFVHFTRYGNERNTDIFRVKCLRVRPSDHGRCCCEILKKI